MSVASFIFAGEILSAVVQEECEFLAEMAQGLTVLELGSQFGRSTISLASTAARIHAVDWHLGDAHAGMRDSLPEYVRNLERHKVREKVVTHVGRNDEILPLFKPGVFDMVFIDSFHEEASVEADIALVLPLMKAKGLFTFHDYSQTFPGVIEAVNNFAQSRGAVVKTVRSVAAVRL